MPKEASRLFWAVILYMAAAIVLSWPVAGNLTDKIVGSGGDPWQTLWRFEHKLESLKGGEALDGTRWEFIKEEFGGQGQARLVNLSVWPWMGIHLAAGGALSYNLIWLFSYVLAGVGAYLLVRELTRTSRSQDEMEVARESRFKNIVRQEGPAFIAGLIYMFLPFHEAHSFGHLGAMQVQWLPLILTVFVRWWRRATWLNSLLLVILITIQAWTEHHYALWLGVFSLLALLVYRRQAGEKIKDKRRMSWVVVIGALLLLTVVLPYWPTIRLAAEESNNLSLGQEQTIRFSADLFAWVVPAVFHPLWGGILETATGQNFTGNVFESTQYLGITVILLIIFFGQGVPVRQRRLWYGTAFLFILISLGPRLHVLGNVLDWPLPYAIIDGWPVFSAVRAVARAGVMVGLAVSVLAGWVIKTQVRRPVNMMIIGGLVLVEFLMWPPPMQSANLPVVYEHLKNMPGETVIEIPAATNYTAASRALYGSLKHDKRVAGSIALERGENPEILQEAQSLPAMRQLMYLRTEHILQNKHEFLGQDMNETIREAAIWLKAREIIIHKDSLSEKQLEAVAHLLEDVMDLRREVIGDVWLYRLEGDYESDGIFMGRDGKWNVVWDNDEEAVRASVKGEAELQLYNINADNTLLEIYWIRDEGFDGELTVEGGVIMNDSFNGDTMERVLRIDLPPGKHAVQIKQRGNIEILDPQYRVVD